jgi:hypothetical protein
MSTALSGSEISYDERIFRMFVAENTCPLKPHQAEAIRRRACEKKKSGIVSDADLNYVLGGSEALVKLFRGYLTSQDFEAHFEQMNGGAFT